MVRKRTPHRTSLCLERLEDRCLLSAGALDSTFGTGGLVVTDLGSTGDRANDMVIQSDGKIVTAGVTVRSGTSQDFALVRYNSNGTLDTSFGTSGRAITDFKRDSDQAYAVVQQADGKFVAAGYATSPQSGQDFGLARYNANGTLDTSFGSKGKVITTISRFNDWPLAMAMQTDGKIIVAGFTRNSSERFCNCGNFVVARYNANGSLDAAFGNGGIVITDFAGQDDTARGVAIQTDGKIVVAGSAGGAGFGIVRYNPNGSLDLSFASQGKVTTTIFGDVAAQGSDIAIQADGQIVVAGNFVDRLGTSNSGIALARYNPNGSLDTTFDLDGIVTIQQPSSIAGFALALQSNGKFVVAGQNGMGTGPDFLLTRVNANGSLDATFGTGGLVITDFGPTFGVPNSLDRANAVAIQADGKIVAAGSFSNSNESASDFALARYVGDPTLQAASLPARSRSQTINAAQAQPLLLEALARWQAAGVDTTALGNIQIQISNLGGATLGMASGNTIWLDDNAAGWGWFVDASPADDSEFTTPGNQGEPNRMDLLTAVTHELGHILGLEHDEDGVMVETLLADTRSEPSRVLDVDTTWLASETVRQSSPTVTVHHTSAVNSLLSIPSQEDTRHYTLRTEAADQAFASLLGSETRRRFGAALRPDLVDELFFDSELLSDIALLV